MADLQTLVLYCSLFISLFFEVFLLITYLEVRGEIKAEDERFTRFFSKPSAAQYPSVTVIVPCFNEEKTVAATVKSILNLDYPREKLSLILVDDGSVDGTLSALKKFKSHPQVKIITKENGGKRTLLSPPTRLKG